MSRHNTLTTILHNVVAQYLRHIFKREWDQCYQHMPWTDDNSSLANFLNLEKNKKKASTNLKNSGDRNSWDLTTLFYVLLYSDSIGQKLKNQPQPTYYTAINCLRLNRNAVSHVSPSTYTSNDNFHNRYKEIKQCLNDLGFPDAHKEMDDVVKQQSPYYGGTFAHLNTITIIIGLLLLAVYVVCITLTVKTSEDVIIPTKSFNNTVISDLPSQEYMEAQNLHQLSFSLPSGNPDDLTYLGLKGDLNKLIWYVLRDDVNLINMVGPAGFGKTTLSIALGKHFQDIHQYKVAYANFINMESIPPILEKLLSYLGFQQIPQVLFPSLQKSYHPSKTLVILEDVDYVTEVYPEDFLHFLTTIVNLKQITVLTTSRREWNWRKLECKIIYHMDHLPPDMSTNLLLSVYPKITKEKAQEITKTVHSMPFLLEIIGHQLKLRFFSPEDILLELHEIFNDVDPDNSYSITLFPIIQVLVSKIHLKFRIQLLKNGFGINDDWDTENNYHLVNLGLLQNRSSSQGSQFEMHHMLKLFAQHTCSENAVHKLKHIQPLQNVIILSFIVNILGKFLVRKNEVMSSIVRWFCMSFKLVLFFYCFTNDLTTLLLPVLSWFSSMLFYTSGCALIICFLEDLFSSKWSQQALLVDKQFSNSDFLFHLKHFFNTAIHWLFCGLFSVLIYYLSYFLWTYVTFLKSESQKDNLVTIMSREEVSLHLVICLMMGFVTIQRSSDVFRCFHSVSVWYFSFTAWLITYSTFMCVVKDINIQYSSGFERFILGSVTLHCFIFLALAVGLNIIYKSKFFIFSVVMLTFFLGHSNQFVMELLENFSTNILPLVWYSLFVIFLYKYHSETGEKNLFIYFSLSYLNWIAYIIIKIFADESNFQLQKLSSYFVAFDFTSLHIIIAGSTFIMTLLLNDNLTNKLKSVSASYFITMVGYQAFYAVCYICTGDNQYFAENEIILLESMAALPAVIFFSALLSIDTRAGKLKETHLSTVLLSRLISVSVLHLVRFLYLVYSRLLA